MSQLQHVHPIAKGQPDQQSRSRERQVGKKRSPKSKRNVRVLKTYEHIVQTVVLDSNKHSVQATTFGGKKETRLQHHRAHFVVLVRYEGPVGEGTKCEYDESRKENGITISLDTL